MTNKSYISEYRELQTRIDMSQHIVITTHIGPDGDALGSELAFYYYLKSLNKHVNILNHSALSDTYTFMDPQNIIQKFDKDQHQYMLEMADILICVDIGDIKRIGDLEEPVRKLGLSVINIDHHPAASDFQFTQEIIDTEACSTGTIIFHFLEAVAEKSLTQDIAKVLYIALMTDTGNFKYNNTKSETHRIAASLLKFDINPATMYQRIYEQFSIGRMALLGHVLQYLHYSCDGHFVWFAISQADVSNAGAIQDDTDGFSDLMRSIHGVEVSMMLKERDDGTTRINFRSKGRIEMLDAAKKLKGGGHKFACGASSDMKFTKAVKEIPAMIEDYITSKGLS